MTLTGIVQDLRGVLREIPRQSRKLWSHAADDSKEFMPPSRLVSSYMYKRFLFRGLNLALYVQIVKGLSDHHQLTIQAHFTESITKFVSSKRQYHRSCDRCPYQTEADRRNTPSLHPLAKLSSFQYSKSSSPAWQNSSNAGLSTRRSTDLVKESGTAQPLPIEVVDAPVGVKQ